MKEKQGIQAVEVIFNKQRKETVMLGFDLMFSSLSASDKKILVQKILKDKSFQKFFKINAFGDSPSLSKAKKGQMSIKTANSFLDAYKEMTGCIIDNALKGIEIAKD